MLTHGAQFDRALPVSKRATAITEDGLGALFRHHPYLLLLQKEDWREYLQLLAQIYDLLEEHGSRVPMDLVRALAARFYSAKGLSSLEQKVAQFFSMAIGELQVLRDSHDQLGQRYLEPTRAGKSLLQWIESLIAQRHKFSGTGAETLLGALNDILISRKQMTVEEAIRHHKEKIEALREDLTRIRKEGLAAAQLLPLAHSNEALFSQAEEASIHILHSIEEVKDAIEDQRKELAAGYFQIQRSAGETLAAVVDFYDSLYASPQYTSYIQAKELLSHLDGFQARFTQRNVDRLLHSIENNELLAHDLVRRSNLRGFMHRFGQADTSIQEKIKAQLRILQQQVLYSISTDVRGLRASLHDLLVLMIANPAKIFDFWQDEPLPLLLRESFEPGPVELFSFDLPVEIEPHSVTEESFNAFQERELFLELVRAEEGTLKDIVGRLLTYLEKHGELRAREHIFPRGLAEYYVLSEIGLFHGGIELISDGEADLKVESKYGSYVLNQAPAFILRRKELVGHGQA